jgi:hypothetical protein
MAQGGGQPLADALDYSRGFLVTGNYVVSGVDLKRTGGTGTLRFNSAQQNQIPADAEITGAYLYWESVEPAELDQYTGVIFRGSPIDIVKASRLSSVPGTGAKCWGSSGGSNAFLTMYRADVLHLLPKQYDANDKWTGRYLVNDSDLTSHKLALHTVTLPQQGTGNRTVTGAGATLLLVYRHPGEPLRKIVIYDGVHAQAQGTTTTQTLQGFYRSAPTKSARLTAIVGSGADNKHERLLFNGTVVATNPFPAPIDSSSDRGWANPTFDVSALMSASVSDAGFGETATLRIDHGPTNARSTPYECLALGAVVFSTTVADADADGLPDGIEDAPAGLKDPPTPAYPDGAPIPNLHAMGASVGQRDLFVEINAMTAPAGTTYGAADTPFNATHASVVDTHGHDHMPSPAVLKMVGDAFSGGGIKAHFDVGNLDVYDAAFPCPPGDVQCEAGEYLVPSQYARGGERIAERSCPDCQFEHYPGTVGWPFGLQLYRDAPVGQHGEELATLAQFATGSPEDGKLRRRFDRIRQDYFHYALYAHARGKAKSPLPCLDVNGTPRDYDSATSRVCAVAKNPQFHVPTSASGVADLPGGNILVTLGLWDTEFFVGSPFVQASTTLHEIGHNLGLWHGGQQALFGNKAQKTSTYVEPNCKPNYLSSMSYLFQVHGLFDESGNIHLDYSGTPHGAVNEASLAEGALLPAAKYRAAWFAPANSALAAAQGASGARRYCNGAPFQAGAPPVPLMARVQADNTVEAIDWDGNPSTSDSSSDVNFDGAASTALKGHDDWASIRLDQIRAGRSARIVSAANGDLLDFGSGDLLDFGSGDLLDFGSGDLLDFGSGTHMVHLGTANFFTYGSGDLLDFGSGDLLDFGSGDLLDFGSGVLMYVGADGDLLDFGSGDLLDFGSGDLLDFGTGDLLDFGSGDLLDFGSGDLLDFGSGDLLDFGSGTGVQELDFEVAFAFGTPRPFGLTSCVLGVECPEPQPAPSTPDYHRIKLTWKAPTFGAVDHYEIYRSTGALAPAMIGTSETLTFIDAEELPNGVTFTYSVRARFADNSLSPHSDSVAETAVNEPPVAADDTFVMAGATLTVNAAGVLANDTQDVDSPLTSRRLLSVTGGPSHGSLTANPDGSFTYTPNGTFAGVDGFTYTADNGAWSGQPGVALSEASNAATVTITALNVPPVCGNINVTIAEGTAITLNANCADANGDVLAVTGVTAPSIGRVTLNPNGSFVYQSTWPFGEGTDTFTYTVTDGTVSVTGTVTVHVTPN